MLTPSSKDNSPPKPSKSKDYKGGLKKSNKVNSRKEVRYLKHHQS